MSNLLTVLLGFFIGSFAARSRLFARLPKTLQAGIAVIALVIALFITACPAAVAAAMPDALGWIPRHFGLFTIVFLLSYLLSEDMMVGL